MKWFKPVLHHSLHIVLTIYLALVGLSCSHPQMNLNSPDIEPFNEGEYKRVIKNFTRSDRQYSGFYQSYELTGTLVTSEVNHFLLLKKGNYHQWDAQTRRTEREKSLQEMSNQTVFLFSLYTPERDYNDLNKGTSIWKTYLEVGGVRYEGKVKKRNDKPVDITSLFYYHTRWSVPYRAEFSVPTARVENQHCRIIFTSSLGVSTFNYGPNE